MISRIPFVFLFWTFWTIIRLSLVLFLWFLLAYKVFLVSRWRLRAVIICWRSSLIPFYWISWVNSNMRVTAASGNIFFFLSISIKLFSIEPTTITSLTWMRSWPFIMLFCFSYFEVSRFLSCNLLLVVLLSFKFSNNLEIIIFLIISYFTSFRFFTSFF